MHQIVFSVVEFAAKEDHLEGILFRNHLIFLFRLALKAGVAVPAVGVDVHFVLLIAAGKRICLVLHLKIEPDVAEVRERVIRRFAKLDVLFDGLAGRKLCAEIAVQHQLVAACMLERKLEGLIRCLILQGHENRIRPVFFGLYAIHGNRVHLPIRRGEGL